ncbi:MAG: amino-acid N-acetyltransferase [Congregibacter sp.]
MNSQGNAPIAWFRNTAPYINLHRGSTFVVVIPSEMAGNEELSGLLHDVALLSSLGVRIVLVQGCRTLIDDALEAAGITSEMQAQRRITTHDAMPIIQQVCGAQRLDLEARISTSLPNSPMAGSKLRVASGNFVLAQPLGVVDGVDYQFTGRVRRIDRKAIQMLLDEGMLVLLSTIGFSPSGEAFNLTLSDVAISVAKTLKADKLLLLGRSEGIHDDQGKLVRQSVAEDCTQILPADPEEQRLLAIAKTACDAGVTRCHIVSGRDRDALLTELFTTDGSGTLITRQPYEQSRWANINDVGGIIDLIAPLEEEGVLLKRSRERLEGEISRFRILVRDGRIIACAALYPFPEDRSAELACIVSHPDYRGEKRAQRLLTELEAAAVEQGLSDVFVLTTQTAHWFLEQGFVEGSIDTLPQERQALYNLQRNSKVFKKTLTQGA